MSEQAFQGALFQLVSHPPMLSQPQSHGSSVSSGVTTPSDRETATDEYFGTPSQPQTTASSVTYVFPDTMAFDRVRAKCNHAFDPLPVSRIKISGYEAYLVERWIARRLVKNQIVIFTGNLADSVVAYRFEIVNEPVLWPASFRHYMAELQHSKYCFPTQSEYGTVFVTNTAQLDASLSLVAVPGGNLEAVFPCYLVNRNLKRLGCGARSATTIAAPSIPVEDKFKSTFRISARVPLSYAVREVVCVFQTFLYYYGVLRPAYCDGFFCDKTEDALAQWWKVAGEVRACTKLLRHRPPNCTVASSVESVIGLTLFVRGLLELGHNAYAAPKDPLDVSGFQNSVVLFQKSQKIHRRKGQAGFLDEETLGALFDWAESTKPGQNFSKDFTKVKHIVKDFTSANKAIQTLAGISDGATSRDPSRRQIDCQDMDQVLESLALGKRLSYLFFGKGKPVDFRVTSLAASLKARARRVSSGSPERGFHLGGTRSNGSRGSRGSRFHLPILLQSSDSLAVSSADELNPFYGRRDDSTERTERVELAVEKPQPIEKVGCTDVFGECEATSTTCDDTQGLEFEKRLRRRHSIPYIAAEASVMSTQLDVTHSVHLERPVLRRSKSFSLVEEAINTTNSDPSMLSTEYLARQYLCLFREYKLGVLKRSADFKLEVMASKLQFLNHLHMDRVLARYHSCRKEYTKVALRYRDLNDKLRNSCKANARLRYELRSLLQKTKEIESNLKSLEEIKINALDQRIRDACEGFHVTPAPPKCATCTPVVQQPDELAWDNLVHQPSLIVRILACYIRCLWLVYFANKSVPGLTGRSETFQALFHTVYNGVDRKD